MPRITRAPMRALSRPQDNHEATFMMIRYRSRFSREKDTRVAARCRPTDETRKPRLCAGKPQKRLISASVWKSRCTSPTAEEDPGWEPGCRAPQARPGRGPEDPGTGVGCRRGLPPMELQLS